MKLIYRLPPSGFTLLELMIVITVISILAIIGFSVFTNIQKTARDGVRRAEITSLAKSIETAGREATSSAFFYDSAKYQNDFPQNKPLDPRKNASDAQYCYTTSSSLAGIGVISTWNQTAATCPSVSSGSTFSVLIDNLSVYAAGGNLSNAKYWKICALLEVGTNNTYCKSSSQP